MSYDPLARRQLGKTSLRVTRLGPGTALLKNVERMRTPIPADLWAELRSEGLLHEAAPVPSAG